MEVRIYRVQVLRKWAILGLFFLAMLSGSSLVGAQAEEAAVYTVTIDYHVQNIGANKALNVEALIFLFDNISGWAEQVVLGENIVKEGTVISPQIFDTEDNRWTQITLGDLEPRQSKTIVVTQILKVGSVDLSIDPDLVGATFPPRFSAYTQPVDGLFESNNSALQALALQLTENTTNPYYKAKQIFEFLMNNLKYKEQLEEHGALWAYENGILENRGGDCTEYSNLFIALARAAGIPAKAVLGFGYDPDKAPGGIRQLTHEYFIFYLPKKAGADYGWVPADAVWPRNIGSFGKIDYAHIAGAITGGEGVVDEKGRIIWPGPGFIGRSWEQYKGQPTTLGGSWAGSITPEILVDVSLSSPTIRYDTDILTLTMTVKNLGRSSASNLVAELDLDPTYFEVVTTAQQMSSLTSGEKWVTSFDVRLKEGAYNKRHTLTSKVTYESSYGTISGTFLAKGETPVPIPPKPVTPRPVYDVELYALIGALVGAIAVLGITLARR